MRNKVTPALITIVIVFCLASSGCCPLETRNVRTVLVEDGDEVMVDEREVQRCSRCPCPAETRITIERDDETTVEELGPVVQ